MAKNYINNKDFHEALVKWNEEGKNVPIPDYIALCFHEIAERRGRKWYRHTALEEMKGEAVAKCIEKINNYDINHPTQNPFAYFSTIVANAFQQVMNKERKLADYKFNEVRENISDSSGIIDWNIEYYSNQDDDGNYIDREYDNLN